MFKISKVKTWHDNVSLFHIIISFKLKIQRKQLYTANILDVCGHKAERIVAEEHYCFKINGCLVQELGKYRLNLRVVKPNLRTVFH
jgi:hypothetical protein